MPAVGVMSLTDSVPPTDNVPVKLAALEIV